MKKAFTLIELLVVIAIIGILAGVILASAGGATESARATKCLSNMRSLAVAANAYAMKSRYYPLAGSREAVGIDKDTGEEYYTSQPGWISWLCRGHYDDGNGNARSKEHKSNPNVPFYDSAKFEDMTYALTNGTLWISSAKNRTLYLCPEHVRFRKENKMKTPFYSYVMNARFGWDTSKGAGAVATDGSGSVYYGSLTRADKTLLFAELPTRDEKGNKVAGSPTGLQADCVLQYEKIEANTKNKSKGAHSSPAGEAESIGFVHKAGKRGRCAHVAFADGHTEKLLLSSGGVDPKKLTAYLCRGWDVIFDSKNGWSLAPDADKMD